MTKQPSYSKQLLFFQEHPQLLCLAWTCPPYKVGCLLSKFSIPAPHSTPHFYIRSCLGQVLSTLFSVQLWSFPFNSPPFLGRRNEFQRLLRLCQRSSVFLCFAFHSLLYFPPGRQSHGSLLSHLREPLIARSPSLSETRVAGYIRDRALILFSLLPSLPPRFRTKKIRHDA